MVTWKCCGCGAVAPDRREGCNCPTELLYAAGEPSRHDFKIRVPQTREGNLREMKRLKMLKIIGRHCSEPEVAERICADILVNLIT